LTIDLNGKVVLVVGGAGGIGLGIAKAFAAEGSRVALSDVSKEALESVAGTAGGGGSFLRRPCDITDRGQVSQLFQWLDDEVGSIDILVNSAGINVSKRMMSDIDPAEFDRVMEINTTGTFNCIHSALGSLAGKRAMLLAGLPYCVSKFATAALGTFVNLEECGNGIKVTNIYPGETNTPIVDKRPSPPPPERRAQMLQPEDIAACVIAIAKLPPRAVVPELVITPPHMMVG
jgi:NAD(P)-dependent dehydrogenase (short-subunit alcohol dehydrogenase family)